MSRLVLSPHGRLFVEAGAGAETDAALAEAFGESSARGLLALAARREAAGWAAEKIFWREFADAFLTALAHTPEDAVGDVAMPPELGFHLTLRIPAMRGAEYASPDLFAALWRELAALAAGEARQAGGRRAWLGAVNPALHLLGKVTFHLAENKRSPETPFAFMATFTDRKSVV